MATPAPKSDKVAAALEGLFARSSSIEGEFCVPAPFGCGRKLEAGEIDSWEILDAREYRISGLCPTCQAAIFYADED